MAEGTGRTLRRWAVPDEPEEVPVEPRRSRLRDYDANATLYPFSRAQDLTDLSLYWAPVATYPMRSRERQWLMQFLSLLRDELKLKQKLRIESFLQFKALDTDVMDTFLKRTQDYLPLAGISVHPGERPPAAPTYKQVEAEVEKGGPIDVKQWMADYCYWFLAKEDERQRQDFFGYGSMMLLFMAEDPASVAPKLELPRVMRTHPAMKNSKLEQEMHVAYSLTDKFLKQSKEVFGKPLEDDPSYPGIPFVVPLLGSEDFFRSTPEQRATWFGLFDAYCIESPKDKGFLLAVKDPAFDETLTGLLKQMREIGMEYSA